MNVQTLVLASPGGGMSAPAEHPGEMSEGLRARWVANCI